LEALAEKARMIIARDLDLAISVTQLGQRIGQERGTSAETPARLLRELSRHPSLFRIVDPWRGPWRTVPGNGWDARRRTDRPVGGERASGCDGAAGRVGPSLFSDARMVVPVDVDWADGEACLARRLRESIYRIGRSVDEHSAVSIARWARLVRAAAAAQRRLRATPFRGTPECDRAAEPEHSVKRQTDANVGSRYETAS